MQVRLVVKSLGYDETTKWLSVLPIYHISGLSVLLRSIIEGFTVRILEKYNTQTMLAIIKAKRPTHVSLVPQTLKWLMDAIKPTVFNRENFTWRRQIIIHAD